MASEILCSHKFCDTKQMGRGERSLYYHIAYSTERKASEHASAFLKLWVFPGKRTYALFWEKPLRQSMPAEEKHTCTCKELLILVFRRRGSAGDIIYLFICSLPAGFGDFHFPAGLVISVAVQIQSGTTHGSVVLFCLITVVNRDQNRILCHFRLGGQFITLNWTLIPLKCFSLTVLDFSSKLLF